MRKLIFAISTLLFSPALAQTITWDGGSRTHLWSDAGNWDTNTVPCSTCDVIISNDSVVFDRGGSIKSLKLGSTSGAQLTIPKDILLTISSSSAAGLTLLNNSAIHITGLLNINSSGAEGCLLTSGKMHLYKFGVLTIDTATDTGFLIENDGEYDSQSGQINILNSMADALQNYGKVVNNGLLTINNTSDNALENFGDFTNQSSLKVEVNSYFGILNEAIFDNQGTLQVNGQSAVPFINRNLSSQFSNSGAIKLLQSNTVISSFSHNAGTFTNETNGSILANSLGQYNFHVSSRFNNYGEITIQSGTSNSLENYHNAEGFYNYGEINIQSGSTKGFMNRGNDAVFRNMVDGVLNVDNCAADAVYNEGKLVNEGTFTLGLGNTNFALSNFSTADSLINYGSIFCQAAKVRSTGPFYNMNGGSLVLLDELLINSKLVNAGIISSRFSHGQGISLADTLVNTGSVSLSAMNENGILNSGASAPGFILNQGGTIVVSTAGYFGMRGDIDVYNEGIIRLYSCGLDGIRLDQTANVFYNNGELLIDGAEYGIQTSFAYDGEFFNDEDGEIVINNCSSDALSLRGELMNKGAMMLTAIDGNGFYTLLDTLFNEGQIVMQSIQNLGLNARGFVNSASGNVSIDTTGSSAISSSYIQNGGVINISQSGAIGLSTSFLDNSGVLNIVGTAESGIRLNSGDGILNNVLGEVKIENCAEQGVYLGTSFTNYGSFEIKDVDSNGMLLYALSAADSVVNSGTLSIADIGLTGMARLGGSPAYIKNMSGGLIRIDTVGQDAISRFSTFTNEPCATIIAGGRIGDMINEGHIISTVDTVNNFIELTNNGLFQDLKGVIRSIDDFYNHGILVQPIKGRPSEGINEHNAITGAAGIFSKDYSFRVNRALTGPSVGNFDYLSQTVNLNASGIAADTVFLSLDIFPGCEYTLSVPIWQNVDCQGEYIEADYDAPVGITTTDWFKPGNWSTGQVPYGCTNVFIDRAKTIIPAGSKARVHHFEIERRGTNMLDIQAGAVFESGD